MSAQVENKRYSAVIYTDGSASPNPGYGGWGMHGYTYDYNDPITIPQNQKKNILTAEGFKDAHDLKGLSAYRKKATINGYGSADIRIVNNNQMELKAIEKALTFAKDNAFDRLHILSDSQFALNAIGHWYDRWEKNNWLNSKGEPVKLKPQIQEAYKLKQALEETCQLSLSYVKGHSNNLGNDAADKLAAKGTWMHRHGKTYEEITIEPVGEKKSMRYHDFFTKNRWYFFGMDKHPTQRLGDWYIYYNGTMGKGRSDDQFGMHMPDGFISIIALREPEPIIEKVQSIYQSLCPQDYNFVVCGRLDTILTAENYHEIEKDNLELICIDKSNKTLSLPNGKVICAEYNPVHLSYIQMERYERVKDVLASHLYPTWIQEKHLPKLTYTDITSSLVEAYTDPKKKKAQTQYRLYQNIVRDNFIKCQINYSTEKDIVRQEGLKLTLRVELPDKVHLAKLIRNHQEKLKISVATYRISDSSFGYMTIIEAGDAVGIWTNLDTCVVLLKHD